VSKRYVVTVDREGTEMTDVITSVLKIVVNGHKPHLNFLVYILHTAVIKQKM
jgi:hypothetical protein